MYFNGLEILKPKTKRFFTLLIYISCPTAGGGTTFNAFRKTRQCTEGTAILFKNRNSDNGSLIEDSYHHARLVRGKGTKIVAQILIEKKTKIRKKKL